MIARKTTRAGASDSELTENDTGTGPATSVPHLSTAKEIEATKEPERPFRPAVTTEADEHASGDNSGGMPAYESDSEAVAAIYKIFRQKLRGLRKLPRWARPAALRAAREWLAVVMNDLREQRAYKRHALYMLRRQRGLQSPSPGGQ
jgi:hypothetical protein